MTRTTHPIWILASGESARAAALYGHKELARALLGWATRSAGEAACARVLSDLPQVLAAARSLGLETVEMPPRQNFEDVLRTLAPGLVLAPHRGPLCPGRVRRVLAAAEAYPGHGLTTALRVPVNCHPAWLGIVPRNVVSGGIVQVEDFKTSSEAPLSQKAKQRLGLSKGRVKGSQWLPELHAQDGTVVFLPEGFSGALQPVCDEPEDYEDLPRFYRLPVFQLPAGMPPAWNPSPDQVRILFHGPCATNPGERYGTGTGHVGDHSVTTSPGSMP